MNKLLEDGFKDVTYLLHPGIYVLVYEGEVMYVGQSKFPLARIGIHDHDITYDRVYFIRCPRDKLLEMEAEYIAKLNPKLNKTTYISGSRYHLERDADRFFTKLFGKPAPEPVTRFLRRF